MHSLFKHSHVFHSIVMYKDNYRSFLLQQAEARLQSQRIPSKLRHEPPPASESPYFVIDKPFVEKKRHPVNPNYLNFQKELAKKREPPIKEI